MPASVPAGAPLQLGNVSASRALSSPSLDATMQAVVSERASNLTDGRWDATLGPDDDILPEVPPDGGWLVVGSCESRA